MHIEEAGGFRTWKVAYDLGESPARGSVDPLPLPEMVKQAALYVKDVPFEKTAELANMTVTNIWRHREAHPYALVLLMVEKYGEESLTWHPELLQLRMKRDRLAPSNAGWTKLLAGRCLFTSDLAWNDWQTFHWVALGLSGKSPNFGLLEEPEIDHLILMAEMMRTIFPDREPSEEIQKFVAACLKNDSLIYAPYPIEFCQDELDDAKVKCRSCGAIHRDDGDRVCVTCGKETLSAVPHPFQEELDRTRTWWAKTKDLPLITATGMLPDDYVGNSVYRMLTYWDAAKDSRKALMYQLSLIGGLHDN